MVWEIPDWWNEISSRFSEVGSPGLELYLAQGSELRLLAREFLRSTWPEEFPDREEILNLDKRPTANSRSLSISHCPGWIGVLISRQDSRETVGLDIEIAKRVKPNVAARVSDPEEFSQAPSPAQLWCAKESTFKALKEGDQPQTISGVRISNWKRYSESVWGFECPQAKAYGFVVTAGELVCAAAAAASSASVISRKT